MTCLTARGAPTGEACGLLRLLRRPGTPEKAALCLGLPMKRVREDLGELVAAGLVEAHDGTYRATPRGRAFACAAPEVDPFC